MLKRLATRGSVMLATLLILLVVGEFVARQKLPLPGYHKHARTILIDPDLGFRFTGGILATNSDEFGVFDYRLNRDGGRGPELPDEDAPKSKERILFIGDSFVNAWSVREELHMMSTLVEELGKEGREAESFALSCDDYGTGQELLLLEKYGERVRPDVVVLTLFPFNDVANNSLALAGKTLVSPGDYIRPYVSVDAEGDLDVTYMNPVRARLRGWSRGFAYYERRAVAAATGKPDHWLNTRPEVVPPNARLADGKAPTEALELFREHEAGHPWEEAWRDTEDLLRGAKVKADALGARLVVLVIPYWVQVQVAAAYADLEVATHEILQADPVDVLDLNYPERRLSAYMRTQAIEGVLLLDPLREAAESDTRLYVQDGHLSWRGHAIAGRELAKQLSSTEPSYPATPETNAPSSQLDESVTYLDFEKDGHFERLGHGWADHMGKGPPEVTSRRAKSQAGVALTSSVGDFVLQGIVPDNVPVPLTIRVEVNRNRRREFELTQTGPFKIRSLSPIRRDEEPKRIYLTFRTDSVGPSGLGLIIEEIGFAPVEPEIPGFPTATFLEHDLDADGVLSITEVPAEQVPNFDLIDRNQDGVVSRTEVVRWIEAGAPTGHASQE